VARLLMTVGKRLDGRSVVTFYCHDCDLAAQVEVPEQESSDSYDCFLPNGWRSVNLSGRVLKYLCPKHAEVHQIG